MMLLMAGDDLALNTLMTRWGGRVTSFLLRMTGQHEVAVDLAQETFVKLYQARARYKLEANFSTWLFAIAANLARNHKRWVNRHPTLSIDASGENGKPVLQETADPSLPPAEQAIARENAEAVRRAIVSLPSDLREALTLFTYQDLGYAEIAEISGCSSKAVETRIYRARQILKEQLRDLR